MTALPSSASPDAAQADIDSARRTLTAEADGLVALARGLDGKFHRAVELLNVADGGRIVVTGMGKSGHVGRKIAATLASTGSPSTYVHPAEASHGDLGMITQHDTILALSNSGETPELNDIIAYSRRFALPLVAITSRAESTLAQAADVALVLPDVGEACPLGLAPTTSTTLSMAMGDALAVALLERHGFSSADFRIFHPGGKLGKKLLKVANLMHSGDALPLAPETQTMGEALLEMTAKSFGCVGVTDDKGRLVGVVTDGDLRRHLDPLLLTRTTAEVMTRAPKTTQPNALAAEALLIMNTHAITSLFVVDPDGRPVGILHLHDCLRAGIA